VLGDWDTVVRDPTDVLRFALLLGSGLLLLDKNLEAAPDRDGADSARAAAAGHAAPVRLAVVLGVSLHAWGNLFDVFDTYAWYDDVVHFLLPTLTCSATYIALAQFEIVPHLGQDGPRHRELCVFLITFLIGLGFAALYEIYEAGADWILDNEPPLQDSLADPNTDLL
jgi:hypothetical protein